MAFDLIDRIIRTGWLALNVGGDPTNDNEDPRA
jgi:hypothetical protein